MMDDLCNLGVVELARLYRRKEISPVEVAAAHLERCERLNPILNAYLLILHESALHAARAMESLFQAGIELGPLQGVPVSVKVIIRLRGAVTTAGSRVLLGGSPDERDAAVVRLLRAAGAVIIGKTNLHEFATGDPDPAGPFGLVQNPRCIGCHPGSSSSGAGAAVAAGLGVIAIGTDTGGSVRIPAYLCGVAGLKPTTGRIGMEGVIPLSWSLDTVGPLGRRVGDIAAAWWALNGNPQQKGEWFDNESPFGRPATEPPIADWRVGVPRGGYFSRMHPEVATAFQRTLELLSGLGCRLIDFEPRGVEEMPDLCQQIMQAEGSTYHERYREREHLYGTGFRERILPGREMKATTYVSARRRQIELQQEWLNGANDFDVLVVPSGPALAPFHGQSTIAIGDRSYPFRSVLGSFTRPFNLLGWPAVTLPNGISEIGLPTGVQIAGPPDSEVRLLILGHRLESALGLVGRLGIEPRNRLGFGNPE